MVEDILAKLDLGDMIQELSDNSELRERVNKIGTKTRVLLSSGMLPIGTLLMVAKHITAAAKDNNEKVLNEIEEHIDLGLRVAIVDFPFSGCKNCDDFSKCETAFEGIEPLTPKEAEEQMAILAPTIGEA